ncbi:MAG: N-acetylmuramoyl-L-alanine amidase, partial [Chloroflexales bacterium]|nr:N-acetylmuramoyl-L-alanine amidase [Chloroflexales bacterium]
MIVKGRRRHWPVLLVAALMLAGALCATPPTAATAQPDQQPAAARQDAFAAAAREFGVPESVLLAVAYNLSRWEHHHGAPSVAAGYGPMHLVSRGARLSAGQRGDDLPRAAAQLTQPGFTALEDAAQLLGRDPAALKADPTQNIRGGAALLARYARDTLGALPPNLADWYGAVAHYSGTADARQALDFADAVYATIRQGARRTTSDGQHVALAAQNVQPNSSSARGLRLQRPPAMRSECPEALPCAFAPAAHQLNTGDPTDYGNYDFAARPDDGLDVRYIVIHNTEIDYNLTLRVFQNPATFVSTHYLIRATDGQVAQLV